MKRLTFREYGKWESPGLHAVIIFEEDDIYLDFFIGSTWANPFRPSDPALKTDKAYASIAPGRYPIRFSRKAHNGKPGFNINNNGAVPTTAPNPNQGGRWVAYNVDIHAAHSETWEGSAACLTVDIFCWDRLIAYWKEGEEGELMVERIN